MPHDKNKGLKFKKCWAHFHQHREKQVLWAMVSTNGQKDGNFHRTKHIDIWWIRHGKIWQLHSEWEKHISMKFYNYFLDGKKSKKMWKLFSARENNCPTERKWSRPLIRFSPQPLFCHSHLSCKNLFRINIRG